MKKRLAAALALALTLSGCSLATEEMREDPRFDQDPLVGMVVTREHLDLFDAQAYLEDNFNGSDLVMDGADQSKYQGRIYAQEEREQGKTEDGMDYTRIYYSFDFMDGLYLIQYDSQTLLADGTVLEQFTTGDTSEGFFEAKFGGDEIEGSIYIPEGSQDLQFFFNPVYQDADGRLYVTSGNGMGTNELDTSMSHFLEQENTQTENGASVTENRKVTVTVKAVQVPNSVNILQMSGDNEILNRGTYIPGEMPQTLTPVEGCAYVMVELVKEDGVIRQIFQPGESTIEAYSLMENGYCVGDYTEILWKES